MIFKFCLNDKALNSSVKRQSLDNFWFCDTWVLMNIHHFNYIQSSSCTFPKSEIFFPNIILTWILEIPWFFSTARTRRGDHYIKLDRPEIWGWVGPVKITYNPLEQKTVVEWRLQVENQREKQKGPVYVFSERTVGSEKKRHDRIRGQGQIIRS